MTNRGSAFRTALFLAIAVLAWQVASATGAIDELLFPSPLAVLTALWGSLADGRLPIALAISLARIAAGYISSVILGAIFGTLLGRSELLRETLGRILLGLQALPSICWLPLALLWFGLSESAIIFVVLMGSFLSIATATEAGVRGVPPLYLRAARTMGARGFTLYRTVVLPAALPQIVTGARLGWSFAWRSLLAAELLFVSGGLGQLLAMGRELHDMALVVAVMVVIVAIGLSVERLLFTRIEDALRVRWGLNAAA